jgi:pyruvate formate lyase activating enzyme
MAEALYWEPTGDGSVRCALCPRSCLIPEGGHGVCLGRVNRAGRLFADGFGRCVSIAMDPVEKKPLYHVCPGRDVLSVACNGCNLRCDFCQNWTIAQEPARTSAVRPAELVRIAAESGSFGIAYTYTEPLVWYEFLLETGAAAAEKGLMNILVTNGVVNEEPLRRLLPLVGAMNVDLKSMRPEFYQEHCHADALEAVKRTIRITAASCHVEVTNLLIPGLNDSEEETRELVDFVASVDVRIPLHFSRYFPQHRMTLLATPLPTLIRAADIAAETLYYVYLGNAGGAGRADTACPVCGNLLVRRGGYEASVIGIADGACLRCGRKADFLWCG